MAKKRRRQRFSFWLSLTDREDLELFEKIESLKKERKFTDAIRDGIRLMISLAKGDTSVLFEMYPAIRDKLYAQMEADVMERWQRQQEGEVIQHIIELRGVIQSIKDRPMLSAPMQGTVTMSRVTTEEELKLEVKQVEGYTGNAAQNFLNSMSALTGVQLQPSEPKQIAGAPKQLEVAQFELPQDDDDDLEFFANLAKE